MQKNESDMHPFAGSSLYSMKNGANCRMGLTKFQFVLENGGTDCYNRPYGSGGLSRLCHADEDGGWFLKEETRLRFLAAAPRQTSGKVEAILASIGVEPDRLCVTGEEVLREAQGAHVLLLTTWRLEDMTGEELAERLGESAMVMMIVPGDFEQSGEAAGGALLLRNPISPDALKQAIRAMRHCQARMAALEAKAERLTRQLEERKLIDRAKGRLMDTMGMTEQQAHHHIQRRSMDSGRRIADVAQEILQAEAKEEAAIEGR